jgi:LPXTG-site transpeptidase (sortase) family protein
VPRRAIAAWVVVLVALLTAAGVACLGVGLTRDAPARPTELVAAAPAPIPTAGLAGSAARRPGADAAEVPVRMRIPVIGVRAPVAAVMPVATVLSPPSESWMVGWWAGGARPGSAKGAVVLAGHTVAEGGGAFERLGRLFEDARVMVVTGAGVTHYAVSRVRIVSRAGFARWAPRLTSTAGAARLVLVTCSGWDGVRFRSNTVVVARPTGRAG